MIKKVRTARLKPGMFVHDFDCGWLEIPFLRRSLEIEDELMIDKIIKHGIREVYIDTDKGLDVADAPTRDEVARVVETAVEQLMVEKSGGEQDPDALRREELTRAKGVRKEAERVIGTVMHDVRVGKRINIAQVDAVVEGMIDSVFHNQSAMMCLSRLKTRDEYTFQHSVNVCIFMIAFCRAIGFDRAGTTEVGVGALLHDVGKMKVPQDILNKPARLSEEEFALMQSHVMHSFQVLKEEGGIPLSAITVAFEHHERHDGTGYPLGLKGDKITRIGQMAAIVDVYDAITSDRCYHKGIDPAEALRKLYEWSEFHFCRELVQYFIKCVGVYPLGTMVRMESGYLAVVVRPAEGSMVKPMVRLIYDTKSGSKIAPRDLFLSGAGVSDRIIGYEAPAKWGINPLQYMDIG
ncbi:MAG: HD-GYP domain-containing protein [Nitrospinae bacterium]|nr:HD-GYP domain-containing protein [Nitrospinota bacterium]